eukprot:INCI11299.1.p1 GENE.INCI11299.1~~INCI11299.1.p1  ORF type:complete len:454 (+),score=71.92 INCI11299.1:184-1545(+)
MSRTKGDDEASIRARFKQRVDEFIDHQLKRRREMRRIARQLAQGSAESQENEAATGKQAASSSSVGASATTRTIAGNSAGGAAAGTIGKQQPLQGAGAAASAAAKAGAAASQRDTARADHIEKQRQKRMFYASQFMRPEWLTCRPDFNSGDWMVVARPDGQRCIVAASRGLTTSRTKTGNVLHRWPSELPSGSKKTHHGRNDEYTLLDCVYHKRSKTYFVVDLMCWKGRLLYDTDAAFRMWWLRTKLTEECPTARHRRSANKFSIVPASMFPCTAAGLAAARNAESEVRYARDGVLFYHKQGFYEQGVTPLVRQWKDEVCSRYFVNTNGAGTDTIQRVVLHVAQDGALVTAEGQKLGQLTRAHVASLGIRPGQFLRFRIGGVEYDPASGSLTRLSAPQFESICGPSRMVADSASQIVFQHRARTKPLTVQEVAAGITDAETPPSSAVDLGGTL